MKMQDFMYFTYKDMCVKMGISRKERRGEQMKQCKVFVPFGALGTGISQDAFRRGMEMEPDIISTDAGSTDSGPYYLGTGKGKYARSVVKRDMTQLMLAAQEKNIPITVGSAGTCGSDMGVDELADICREIAAEHHFRVKIACIYTQQNAEVLKEKFRAGKVQPLLGAPEIDESTFDECSTIVGLAGVEPFMEALKQGVDIVICGRATDTAVIAAYPLMKGCDVASSWHAAKIAECGCLCTTNPQEGGVFLTIDEKGFTVAATAADSSCTPYSVSAHMLYENADPVHLTEPGVLIDTTHSIYTQLENGRVRVEGTKAEKRPYTMKLEGSAPAGYQTISLVGIQDRDVMKNPQKWLNELSKYVEGKLHKLGIDSGQYQYSLRPYGYNAVGGCAVPEGYVPNELGVLLTVTANTQELATQVAKTFNPYLLHFPVHRDRQLPSFAFPMSPAETERGKLYAFRLYHVVQCEHPLELYRFKYIETELEGAGND